MNIIRTAIATLLFVALAPFALAKEEPQKLSTITLTINKETIKAELADTEPARQKGLMFREKMGKNEGMVFVFDDPGYHGMWMMNTLIPLSVAFIDADGKILNIREMLPQTQEVHSAAGPAIYALEMNAGWFAEKKIKAGDTVKGLPKPRK